MLTHRHRTILGNIPADWDAKPLKSLITEHFAGDWGDDEGEQAVSVLRSTNFTNDGQLDFSDIARRYFPTIQADQFGLLKGDLLVERSGGGPEQPVGRIGFIESDMPGTTVSNFVQVLRPDAEKVDANFLGWALFELQRTGIVERVQQQSTQMRNLNWRDYQRLTLPWPKIEEQRRISAALGLVDSACQLFRLQLETAKDLKRSLDAGLLTGQIDTKGRSKVATKAGSLPQGWAVLPLKELAVIGSGVTLNQDRIAKENACRYLTVAHVQRGSISVDDPRYLELSEEERKSRLLTAGDILVVEGHANSMEIGRAAIFEETGIETTFQNHLFRVRANRDLILPKFLLHVLNSERVQRYWNAVCNTSSGLNTINRRNLRNVLIPHPGVPEQQAIVASLSAAEQNVERLATRVRAVEDLKRALLQSLLTGAIRVPEGAIHA